MIKMKLLTTLVGLVFSTLLTSCATTVSLSPENKKTIHTVALNAKTDTAKTMYYLTPKTYAPVMLAGVVGALLMQKSAEADEAALRKLAKDNHIYIDKIVRDQFISEIKKHPGLKVVNKGKPDAILAISIPLYGVSIPSGLSKELSPMLHIKSRLTKNDKEIWSSEEYNLPAFNGVPRHSIEEIFNHPKYLNDMWAAQAKILVEKIVSNLV